MDDDRERMEQYLAWRRAQGKDRRGRVRRRLRLAGAFAAVTLPIAALGIAVGGRPNLDTPDILRARPDDPGREGAEAPPDRASTAPASSVKELPARSAAVRRNTATPTDASTYALASPPASGGAPPAAADDTSAAAREVVVKPPAPASTVIVEPPPVVIVEPPAAVPTPPVTAAADPAPAVPPPGRMERLKKLTGYIPEVWLARKVTRWVEQQSPGELSPAPPERTQPQSR